MNTNTNNRVVLHESDSWEWKVGIIFVSGYAVYPVAYHVSIANPAPAINTSSLVSQGQLGQMPAESKHYLLSFVFLDSVFFFDVAVKFL